MESAFLRHVILLTSLWLDGTQAEMKIPKLTSSNTSWGHRFKLPRAAVQSKMTASEKLETVRLHNFYRSKVDPPAAVMEYMEWDDPVASTAQQWAEECVWRHDFPPHNLGTLGQNLYWNSGRSSSIANAMGAWMSEIADYHFHNNTCNRNKQCGHYTQIVWTSSRLVGCGVKKGCFGGGNYFVCNYSPAGNFRGHKPYQAGRPCSRCRSGSGLCWNNLCVSRSQCRKYKLDCDCDLICHNCGELDREKCRCKCKDGWKGTDCSEPGAKPENLQNTCCDGVICHSGYVLDFSHRPCECLPLCPGPKCGNGTLLHQPRFLLIAVAALLLGYRAL